MENKFKKGLILGGILAVGAAVGFMMSREGKELSEELQKDLKKIAKRLKKDLSHLDDVTKEIFDSLIIKIVNEYDNNKDLLSRDKNALVAALEDKWHEMEAEYLVYKDEAILKNSFKEKK